MLEKKCLITTNLIGAIDWYKTAPNSIIKSERGGDGKTTWKDKAEKDLHNLLSRTPGDFPKEAQQGVKFEKQVYAMANNIENIPRDYSKHFVSICKEVSGFMFHQKGGKVLKVGEDICYIYGKYDAIKPNEIIKDIKTTKKYSINKYLNTVQHIFYCFISGIGKFEYIIAEWEEFPKIKNVYKEVYEVLDQQELEKGVITIVSEALQFLKDYNLWELYREKYCLY